MTRYWIFDRDDTPQGRPLQRLIRGIQRVLGPKDGKIVVRRAEGYGARIHSWDDRLESRNEIMVSFQDFDEVSAGTEEWFYNLEAECTTATASVIFGLHDSTALFFEAPPDLAEQITAAFRDVKAERV